MFWSTLIFCMLFCCLLIIFKINFSKNSIRNITRVSKSLDPEQAECLPGLIWLPNCLQKLSAGDTSRQTVNVFIEFESQHHRQEIIKPRHFHANGKPFQNVKVMYLSSPVSPMGALENTTSKFPFAYNSIKPPHLQRQTASLYLLVSSGENFCKQLEPCR